MHARQMQQRGVGHLPVADDFRNQFLSNWRDPLEPKHRFAAELRTCLRPLCFYLPPEISARPPNNTLIFRLSFVALLRAVDCLKPGVHKTGGLWARVCDARTAVLQSKASSIISRLLEYFTGSTTECRWYGQSILLCLLSRFLMIHIGRNEADPFTSPFGL
jgi:hypothetical protein